MADTDDFRVYGDLELSNSSNQDEIRTTETKCV